MSISLFFYRVFFQPANPNEISKKIKEAAHKIPDSSNLNISANYLNFTFYSSEPSSEKIRKILETDGIKTVSVQRGLEKTKTR